MKAATGSKESCGELREKLTITSQTRLDEENQSIHDLTALTTAELDVFIRQNWGNKVAAQIKDEKTEKLVLAISESTLRRRRSSAA